MKRVGLTLKDIPRAWGRGEKNTRISGCLKKAFFLLEMLSD
jgi:hypothetical protein